MEFRNGKEIAGAERQRGAQRNNGKAEMQEWHREVPVTEPRMHFGVGTSADLHCRIITRKCIRVYTVGQCRHDRTDRQHDAFTHTRG